MSAECSLSRWRERVGVRVEATGAQSDIERTTLTLPSPASGRGFA